MDIQQVAVVNAITLVYIFVEVVVPEAFVHVDVVFVGQIALWFLLMPPSLALHQPDFVGQLAVDELLLLSRWNPKAEGPGGRGPVQVDLQVP